MGERARAAVEARFRGDRVVQQYEQLWEASLHGRAPVVHARRHVEGLIGACVLGDTLSIPALDVDGGGFAASQLRSVLRQIEQRRSATARNLATRSEAQTLRELLRLTKYGLLEIGTNQ